MSHITVTRRPYIIGVMGSHRNDSPAIKDAYTLGKEIAKREYVLLTGGGGGVMRAASEGAHHAGGLVVAVLPSEKKLPLEGYPNEYVDIPIYTGMYDARNIINAKTPHVLVALSGSAGTLSEIAIALKSGVPVIGLKNPHFELDDGQDFMAVDTVDEVMGAIEKIIVKLSRKKSTHITMKQHHVAVVCRTRDHADRFYGALLGLPTIKTSILSREMVQKIFNTDAECEIILYGNETMAIEVFVTDTNPDCAIPYVHMCLEIKNRNEFARMCKENGLEVNCLERGDSTLLFIKDFDGNLFEIKELRD